MNNKMEIEIAREFTPEVIEYKNMCFADVYTVIDKEGYMYGFFYEDKAEKKEWFGLDIPMEYHDKFKNTNGIPTDTGIVYKNIRDVEKACEIMKSLDIHYEFHEFIKKF